MIYAKPATSLLVVFRAYLASDHTTPATGKTIAITISKNGGAFGNPNAGATNATEISSGFYKVTLDTTDTGTAGPLAVRGAEGTIDDVGAIFYVGQAPADVTHWLGTAAATPTVAGVPEVDLTHVAGATTNVAALATNVDAILTDTGTTLQGELDGIQADTEDIQARLPAALTADGNIKADTLRIGGTLQTANDVGGDVDAILVDTGTTLDGRIPAALVGGRMDANVGAISADATAADNAEAFFDGTGYAGTGNVIPTVTTLTGHTPQTGDAFARLGAPAGASVSADIAAIEAQTDDIGAAGAGLTALATQASVDAVAAYVDTEVAAIKAKTDNLPTDPADASDIAALIDALPTAAENAAALLDLSDGIETSITPRQALRLILASSAGKLSGAATTTITIRNVGDSKDRITATVDSDGNRSAVTTDAT